ncbi:MAG: hypothetical protein ACK4YQ_13570 [Phenylobacterium sp.]|uniref:hypothetical protein n=1 Tax=Phenylobacterium sp. TaxID=1871053 RepID=UPI00391ABEC8
MKVAIVQFDNRPIEKLGAMAVLLHRNHQYAVRHGYEYHFINQAHFDLPVYWQKPKILHRFFEVGFDVAVWLDSDAVVHDLDRRVEDLFEGGETMVAAPDNPHWTAPFNAGVFAVRQPGGLALMDRWSGLFAGTKWTRTPTAWVCEDEWAGPSYEQGAFNARLLPELTADGTLRLADWRLLQSPFPVEGAFTLHFPGPFRANLVPYIHLYAEGASPA